MGQKVTIVQGSCGLPKVADLAYGCLMTGVPNGKSSIYRKVKKRCGTNVEVMHTKNYCVLLNIQYGTLREIPGDTKVQPLMCDNMEVYEVAPDQLHTCNVLKD